MLNAKGVFLFRKHGSVAFRTPSRAGVAGLHRVDIDQFQFAHLWNWELIYYQVIVLCKWKRA